MPGAPIAREAMPLFIPLALSLTILLGVAYMNDDQILRAGANEPENAMAQDLADTLADDPTATTSVAGPPVPIESSLSPYLVVYDSYGNPIAGTGYLDGALPSIPSGIFDVARSRGFDSLTWQPESGVRSALVVAPINGGAEGFVVGGRSLAYVEKEEEKLAVRALLGWVAVMLAALLGSFVAAYLRKR